MTDIPFSGFVKDLEKFRRYKRRMGDRRKITINPELLKEDKRKADRRK